MTTVAFVRPLPPSGSSETSQYLLEHMAYVMNLEIAMPPATGGWARIVTPAGSRFHAWLPATHQGHDGDGVCCTDLVPEATP